MDFEKVAEATSLIENVIGYNANEDATQELFIDDNIEAGPANKTISEFLDSPLGDEKESIMKKIFTTAMVVAKDKDIIPDIPNDAQSIASYADNALTRIKTAYKVKLGLISPEEAINTMIDHMAARVTCSINFLVDSGIIGNGAAELLAKGAYLIPKVGTFVGPWVEKCKPAISSFINNAGQKAKSVIHSGIKMVTETAKSCVNKVFGTIREKVTAGWNKLFS
ncbi:MAG: hypothetical protein K6E86_06950 [Bacteroidales bacterium]|nr:hypothetical protein [Bacteroidales bacterium]